MSVWLIDNSAWARLHHTALSPARREELLHALETGSLYTSLPFLLEAGWSARSADDWSKIETVLSTLPQAWIDAVVERRALEALRQLIEAGLHRAIPAVDLTIAAIAERHRLTLLHYDHDFDRIAEATDLAFTREWLAPPGTL